MKKPTKPKSIKAIKGFNKDLKCRGFQFEKGKTYKHKGEVKACESGFHSVEYPLDVFNYYPPVDSRFFDVVASGDISRHDGDTKIASASVKIVAEINIHEIVAKSIAWINKHIDKTLVQSNMGFQSAASNTGDYSAASNTGNRSAASNTGDCSAASNTGFQSAASVTGKASVAICTGSESKASACAGSAIVLVNRDDYGNIRHIRASMVGDNGIKPDVFYTLNKNGEFVELA